MSPIKDPDPKHIIRDASILSRLFNSSTDAVFVFDPDGIILDCNSTFALWQTRIPEECIGTNVYEYLEPDVAKSRKVMIDEALSSGNQVTFEDQRAGVRYRQTIYPFSQKGGVTHVTVVAQKLSDDMPASPDRTTVLEFNRSVIESIPGAFFVVDQTGRFVVWNDFMRDVIVGIPEKEMAFADATVYIHPEDRSATLEMMRKIFESSSDGQMVVRALLHSGPEFLWLALRGKSVVIDGKPFLIGSGVDITERKRSDAFREFRLRIIGMAETASVQQLLQEAIDEAERLSGSAIGFFHFFNPDESTFVLQAWSSDTEKSFCDVEGHGLHYPSGESMAWSEAIRMRKTVINNDGGSPGNRKGTPPEGHGVIVREVLVPVIRGLKVVAILGVGNKPYDYDDADARWLEAIANAAWETIGRKQAELSEKSLQEKLIQSQKLEMLGRLAGGIAHDFNNMLSVILGQTELLMCNAELSQRFHEEMETIRTAASRSSKLTRQLLAFARKQTVQPKKINLNNEIEQMLAMLDRVIGENISLEWMKGTEALHTIIDPSQLDQILMNFCVNARDAIIDEGTITIGTAAVEVTPEVIRKGHPCSIPGRYALLTVTDNGTGIAKEHLPHIFEPFFTTKGFGESTGLGLSTVYGIVKQNNGAIECRSEPGQGTIFSVYLPTDKPGQARPDSLTSPNDNVRSGVTILLVEDEPDILKLTKTVLEKKSYNVLAATSAEEAFRMADEHSGAIDVLLTDVILPGLNGSDLSRILRKARPELRTLFMSGYTDDIIGCHGVFDEGVNFLQKPFTIKTLIEKVAEVYLQ